MAVSISQTSMTETTKAIWERAQHVMPGGVNASARYNRALGRAMFFSRGDGPYLYDVDGQRYIDYCISHGASLLGHGHPAIAEATQQALSMGLLLAYETKVQVEVAERLLALFPGMDLLRYACSGTETTWHALRVARAYTGRYDVVKFEGHYHGVNDTVGYSHWPDLQEAGPAGSPLPVADSAGIPPENSERITILPFNDIDALEQCLHRKQGSLAAVIMEPINFDSCGLVPTPAFLEAVRALTAKYGIVLLFDEVLSGFRLQPGPALGDACIPDMTVLGKAVGGGMPISVFMGKREIMEMCTPAGPALHSGTYNAPPLLVMAIGALLDEVTRPNFYVDLLANGERLYEGLREILARRGIEAWVQGVGARFGLLFGIDSEPQTYRDIAGQDMEKMRAFHVACLQRGIYLHFVSPHHGHSSAHSSVDIDETLSVMDDAAKTIA